jgi:hypothetical protein
MVVEAFVSDIGGEQRIEVHPGIPLVLEKLVQGGESCGHKRLLVHLLLVLNVNYLQLYPLVGARCLAYASMIVRLLFYMVIKNDVLCHRTLIGLQAIAHNSHLPNRNK